MDDDEDCFRLEDEKKVRAHANFSIFQRIIVLMTVAASVSTRERAPFRCLPCA